MSTGLVLTDPLTPELASLADLRALAAVRVGARTGLERWPEALGVPALGLVCDPARQDMLAEQHPGLRVNEPPATDGDVYLVGGDWPLPPAEASRIGPGQAIIDRATGGLVVALVHARDLPAALAGRWSQIGVRVAELPSGPTGSPSLAPSPLRRPWHARSLRDAALAGDLQRLSRTTPEYVPGPGVIALGAGGLFAGAGARVAPGVVLDHESGPIVIGPGAALRPACTVIGPAYIGAGSTVLDRAVIRPGTAVGPMCKVNGEIGGVTFQGHSNKAHEGYLGDSWVGAWVNLGAGTTGSNLLNTYGEVTAVAAPGGSTERTGERFFGAVIADHVKTAICTRLMTGSVLHTGAMIATTAAVSGCVPRFAWRTDGGSQRYRLARFEEVMRAVMSRRGVEPGRAYLARVASLHASP